MSRRFGRTFAMGAVVIFSLTLVVVFGVWNKALAIDRSSITAKAVFEGVYGCFNGGAYRKTFYASDVSGFVLDAKSGDSVKLPYGFTDVGDNNLNCKEVMLGYDNSGGIKGGLIPSDARGSGANVSSVKNYFAGQSTGDNGLPGAGSGASGTTGGLGYKAEAMSEGTGKAKKLVYTISGSNCASGEANPTFGGSKTTITFPTVMVTDSGLKITSPNDISSGGASFTSSNCANLRMNVSYTTYGNQIVFEVDANGSYQTIYYNKGSDGELNITNQNLSLSDGGLNYINLSPSIEEVSVPNTTISDYKLTWGGGSAMDFVKGINTNNRAGYKLAALSSGMGYGNLALSKQEVYDLYVNYIENVFKAKLVAEGSSDYSGVDVNLCSSKKYKVNKTNAADVGGVYGVDSNYHFTATVNLDSVIATLDKLGTFDDINNGGKCGTDPTPTPDPGNPSGGGSAMDCDTIVDEHVEGKIGAMQWILCPTMDNTRYTATWIDEMTQNWLEVDTDLYSTSSGAYQVWGMIRNIANVLMVVFLSVIIFSQLTGYGIDNYGIKKMLPRLIVMAIVVNLSFYICEIAIDFSSIAGVGLRNMFGSFGTALGGGENAVEGTTFLGNSIMAIFAAAANSSAAIGAGVTAFTLGAPVAVAIIIAVIVLALVILVAVMILFLMLGAREVMIIFCIIVAPLAFAAFILPNTQNLFKKWWDLFKAAIIIFPICGALSGMSYLLRQISYNAQLPVWGIAIAMILPYLGFFLLPMLLKNAIAALGKVGGALTSLGNTVRSGGRTIGQGAMRAGQNTEAYKNIQNEAARRRQFESAERTIRRMQEIRDRGGTLTDAQTRRLARAQETQRKLGGEDIAARTILAEREYAGESQGQLINRWQDAWQSGDTDQMNALTNVIVSRHGPGGVNALAQRMGMNENMVFDASGNFRNDAMERSFNAFRANMQTNSALANAMQNKAADAYQMISGGGYGDDGQRHNLQYHSAHNSIATQDKDWATQSTATLQRAVASGALTQETARRMLSSTDPAIQSGIQSDAGKRRVLEAAAGGYSGGFGADDNGAINQAIARTRGVVSPSYAGRSADDVRAEAELENQARQMGVNGEYVGRNAESVYDEAMAENREFDRRAEERKRAERNTENQERIADSLDQIVRNRNSDDNNGGQGFDEGAGI